MADTLEALIARATKLVLAGHPGARFVSATGVVGRGILEAPASYQSWRFFFQGREVSPSVSHAGNAFGDVEEGPLRVEMRPIRVPLPVRYAQAVAILVAQGMGTPASATLCQALSALAAEPQYTFRFPDGKGALLASVGGATGHFALTPDDDGGP